MQLCQRQMSLTKESIRYKSHFPPNAFKGKNSAVLNINPVCVVIQKFAECNYWHEVLTLLPM